MVRSALAVTTPMHPRTTSRRRLLAAAAAAFALAGCQSAEPETSPTDESTTAPAATDSPTATVTDSPTATTRGTYVPPTRTERDVPSPIPTPEQNPSVQEVHLDDEGLEPGDSLDPYFDEFLDSGNRIVIPEGEYTHSSDREPELMVDFAIVGDGPVIIDQGEGFENQWKFRQVGGTFEMKNITWKGAGASGHSVGPWGSFEARDDAEIIVENCAWPDGTQDESDGHCIYMTTDHEGDFLLRNCHIEGWGDNGIYGSAPGRWGGTVRIENCLFKDNNVANVRLGSTGSYVKDSVLLQTGRAPLTASGDRNQTNIKHRRSSDIRVENCDIVNTSGRWTLSIHSAVGSGSVEMVDNRIEHTVTRRVCNNNPDVDVIGENNHFVGEWDATIPPEIFSCINDGCEEPSTVWP